MAVHNANVTLTPCAPRTPRHSYETEEHMSVGVPGFGMRISVSKQDLTEIKAEARRSDDVKRSDYAKRGEAYPAAQPEGKLHAS